MITLRANQQALHMAARLRQRASVRFAKQVHYNSPPHQALVMLPAHGEPFLAPVLAVTKHFRRSLGHRSSRWLNAPKVCRPSDSLVRASSLISLLNLKQHKDMHMNRNFVSGVCFSDFLQARCFSFV